jgi:hypothetical protein
MKGKINVTVIPMLYHHSRKIHWGVKVKLHALILATDGAKWSALHSSYSTPSIYLIGD